MKQNKSQETELTSHLTQELGIVNTACTGCISEFRNDLRCYDCVVCSTEKGSNFLDADDLGEPSLTQVSRSIKAAMKFLGITQNNA